MNVSYCVKITPIIITNEYSDFPGDAFDFLQDNNTVLAEMDILYTREEWDYLQK